MRSSELTEGTPIFDENGEKLGKSTVVGRRAISQVVVSRILMASPGMTILPFVMESLEKRKLLTRYPWLGAPIQIGLVGLVLSFVTPLCCAIFPQMSSIPFCKLEPDVQSRIKEMHSGQLPAIVYYNKGL
ncbi:Sideroflexin-1 [Schistosoma japonicum]|nr:Sideroflexin-1 [Schistosoma japonicum]